MNVSHTDTKNELEIFECFLSERGKKVLKSIAKLCAEKFDLEQIDNLQMAMLANSFDIYHKMTILINKNDNWRDQHALNKIKKMEYKNIMTLSKKFELTLRDHTKIYKQLIDK